jgi:prepilin-type N-terminal cleavage/methylation domain-containing protein
MRNQRGFGLIEVMITIGIMSVIMLGLMTATEHAMLVSQTADTKQNLTSLVSSAAGQAFNQVTCTAAVTQTTQTYGQPFQFGDLHSGYNAANYNLTVQDLSYSNAQLVATAYDGTKVYYGTITLTATANRRVLGGQTFAPRIIAAVYLTANPAGTITNCGAVMPPLPQQPTPPPPTDPVVKTFDFDADPKVCENFPVKARCPASQTVVVDSASYGSNCGGVPADYGQSTVQALCANQQNCDFTAGNVNNCTGQGVFIDPAVDCPKSFHMAYHCK